MLVFILATFSLFGFSLICAEAHCESNEKAPKVLVLGVANDDVGRNRERQFTIELQMALNEVHVQVVHPSDGDFEGRPLAEQISLVRTLLDEHDAVAVTWIYSDGGGLLLLHLVAVSTGRALVRLVETDIGQDSEATLALAARELLGTAFLFESPRTGEEGPIDRVVESVKESARIPAPTTSVPWNLMLGLEQRGGIAGHTGPTYEIGGGLTLERRLVAGFYGAAQLDAAFGPFGDADTGEGVTAWSIAPGLRAAHRWRRGNLEIGPAIGVGVTWYNISVDLDGGDTYHFTSWRFRTDLDLEVRWRLGKVWGLFVNSGVSLMPLRDNYRRESNAQLVLASPFLGWNVGLGLILQVGKSHERL